MSATAAPPAPLACAAGAKRAYATTPSVSPPSSDCATTDAPPTLAASTAPPPPLARAAAAPPPAVVDSVLELIGNTPMLRVRTLDTGPCELFLKLESQSIGGSIKDRIAVSMVAAAEKNGDLRPFSHPPDEVFEGTAGNTGLALALVASQRGYSLTVCVPDKVCRTGL